MCPPPPPPPCNPSVLASGSQFITNSLSLHITPAGSIKHYIQEVMESEVGSTAVLADEVDGLRDLPDLVHELDAAVGQPQSSHCDYISAGAMTVWQIFLCDVTS